MNYHRTDDTADLQDGGRRYMDEHRGPITTWDEFEAYPWPDPATATTRWNSTSGICPTTCASSRAAACHFAEHLTWLMGYESLCYALYDQRDLVRALRR